MMSPKDPDDDRSENKNTSRLSRLLIWFRAFDLRDRWWRLLDYFEAHRRARRCLYGFLAGCILVVVSWLWIYPWWARRNVIGMARQWIAAGQPNYAAEAVQKALEKSPRQPELWLLAAELARLNGQKSMEVEYAREAARIQPANSKYALEWAGAALRADQRDETIKALAGVSGSELERSSIAQRLLGELARRERQFEAAINHFESALKIDGPVAIDEVPLGLCLIGSRDPAPRQRGLVLLSKWTSDREWGASALRILLEDASAQNDRPAMAKWSGALRSHPRCTMGDMPNCLAALARSDPAGYAGAIAQLKQAHLASPEAAAQLIGWLDQIGRSGEALEWMKTLPEQVMQRPPLSVAKAESLRLVGDWTALQAWVSQGDWGDKLDFLRWAYGLRASRALGDEKLAGALWLKLQAHAQTDSVHALFAGSTIYTWGLVKEAEALWWLVAGQNNNLAVEALGTLARHYQVQRDADGQYRVFNQLHAMHPQDADVTNNFAFFAALTGNREQLAEQLSRENMKLHPANRRYIATHAFILLMRGHPDESLKAIEPLASEAGKSSAVAFVYGLALAGTGDKTKAREVLKALTPDTLTLRETEVIGAALGD
jgi:tetratricopeptide (TPR) repeat protein